MKIGGALDPAARIETRGVAWRAEPGRIARFRRSFSRVFGLKAVCDLIDLLQESGAILFAVLFRDPRSPW